MVMVMVTAMVLKVATTMAVVSIVTGASIWEAGAVALIEPAVNSVWFYALHKLWKKYK